MSNAPFGSIVFNLNKNIHKYLNNKVLEYDLNYLQTLFLIRINMNPDITQKELADIFFLTKSYVTKSVKDLEKKGFLIRSKNSEDKRRNNMVLTKKSLELLPKFRKIRDELDEKMKLNEIDDKFFKTLLELTNKSIELNEEEK